jgi:hypothetical protein
MNNMPELYTKEEAIAYLIQMFLKLGYSHEPINKEEDIQDSLTIIHLHFISSFNKMIISFYIDKNLNNKTDLSEVAFSTF